jgi:DNA polymerase III subunit delta'
VSFDAIIGHENIKLQIENAFNSGKFSHAHIIAGENGIGKSIIAKEIAIKILNKTEMKQYADIIEYRIQGSKKSLGVDDIRSIVEEANRKPYEGDRKVIILYSADLMTEVAQNAFLKTIEEPPRGMYIILLCEKLDNILDTIKSRCQTYKLHRLSEAEILNFIHKTYNSIDEAEIKSVIAFADGIPGRAQKYLENGSLKEIRVTTLEILKELESMKTQKILKYETFFLKHKNEWQEVFTSMFAYIRDILIYKESGNKKFLINLDKLEDIINLSEVFSFNKLDDIITIIKEAKEKLERNVNTTLVFDALLMKMQEV